MWAVIFILIFVAAVASLIYLSSRFCRFAFIGKLAKENRKLKILFSVIPMVLITAILWLSLGMMNTVVVFVHLVLFWLLSDFVFWGVKRIRKRDFKRYYASVLALSVTLIYLSAAWVSANHVWVVNYSIETEKAVGSLRILQFADSHVGTTFDGEGFLKHVESMQKQNPDVVLITGDFVDDDTSRADMLAACRALGTLKTAYGVYYVFGNHDKGYYDSARRGYDGNDLIEELTANGVTVLQDEAVLIDDRFYIIGRQDLSEEQRSSGRAEIGDLTAGLDSTKFFIVMDHQPSDYAKEVEANVDLVLSGHTHAGQMFPITYVGEWLGANDKTYGYEKRGNTNFIVTSGISDWALSFKTGCKSEFAVIDIKGQ